MKKFSTNKVWGQGEYVKTCFLEVSKWALWITQMMVLLSLRKSKLRKTVHCGNVSFFHISMIQIFFLKGLKQFSLKYSLS